jgi:hypothetical protein
MSTATQKTCDLDSCEIAVQVADERMDNPLSATMS